ncbi:hypothetical protein P8C59_005118 [Phyllachora maydis]|uniref:Uncharacterized protein n=1 Tax=Phyllachora maydis TaxID=1825666 RepID=A0AAD9I3T0_9PEZI|nr:hypothetical protein P8C59_005118 [Phyllachora maydis]
MTSNHASPKCASDKELPPPPEPEDGVSISSNVEFLRSMEDSDPKKKEKGSKHRKRASLTSLGVGTKSIFAGKFGDAFKRFESNANSAPPPPPPRTPSPLKSMDRRDLTPIAGSEATDGRSDDGHVGEEDVESPEMRREREQRMLADEEDRVAAAQAEYRQRLARRGPGAGPNPLPKSIGGVSRAVSIQKKVQSLLEGNNQSSSTVSRTAEGYGHYTDGVPASPSPGRQLGVDGRPIIPRKSTVPTATARPPDGMATAARPLPTGGPNRPATPQKPAFLFNKGPKGAAGSSSPPKATVQTSSSLDVAKVRNSTPAVASASSAAHHLPGQPGLEMTQAQKEDYVRDFQKRFPSLTSIEMVERDLAAETGKPSR